MDKPTQERNHSGNGNVADPAILREALREGGVLEEEAPAQATIDTWYKEAAENFEKAGGKIFDENIPTPTDKVENVAQATDHPSEKAPEPTPEQEVKNILEELTPEEKRKVSLGIDNVGYYVEEYKNKTFAGAFSWARDQALSRGWLKNETILDKEGNEIQQPGKLDRWMQSFSENLNKTAELNRKKKEGSKRTSLDQLSSLGAATGNIIKYGRIISDITGLSLTSPLRYVTMGGMFFGQAFGAGKEARLKNVEVLEKTRVKDINAAANEAWKIYEQASVGKEKVSLEDLEKAYIDNAPRDILNRLEKDPEPGTASNILEKIIKWDVTESLKRISSQLDRIDNDSTLNETSKKIEKEKIIQKYDQHIKDLDRAVGQFGTVDTISLGAKYGEVAAKALVGGLMAETVVLSIEKLWGSLPSILHSAPETVPVSVPSHSEAPVAPISHVEIAKPGDTLWKLAEHQLHTQLGEKFTSLSPEQQTYVIDAVKDRVGHNPALFGIVDINKIEVGQKVDFANALNDKGFIDSTLSHAKGLSAEDLKDIKGFDGKITPMTEPWGGAPEGVLGGGETKEIVQQGGTGAVNAPEIGHQIANIETNNVGGTFTYSPDGKITGFVFDKGKFLDHEQILASRKIFNDNWHQEVMTHPLGVGLEVKTPDDLAVRVYEYELILDALEKQGKGASPEADCIRGLIEYTVNDLENRYGDIVKDIKDFPSPGSAPEAVAQGAQIAPEVVNSRVHAVVQEAFGSSGFFGFGAVDGAQTQNWLDFANRPVSEVMNARPSVLPYTEGPSVGINNNDALNRMQGVIQKAISDTHIQPLQNETIDQFLHRAAATSSAK